MSSTTSEALIASQAVIARPRDERRVSLLVLCLLALGVGILTGIGAVALRALIGLIHNVLINGVFKIAYDANILEGPSRWGNWVVLSPFLGGLVVVYLVDRFAPEAKGHGVPEVMDAIYYKRGDIRGVVALIKSLASALSIGSGASVGREGPIIQIGSALGSAFSKAIGLSTGQKITLLSAGAGAGIAATFNTPLGGVLFAIEILLPEVSNRTFLPVVIATGAATLLGRILIGPNPAFTVPEVFFPSASFGVEEAIAFVCLGALCGEAAWAFIRLLVFMEDGFPKLPGGMYAQNIVGMTLVGLMMVGLTHVFGHSYVAVAAGVRRALIRRQFTPSSYATAATASRRSATSISIWSSRRRTSWSGGSSSPRRARRCGSASAGKTSTICAPSLSNMRAESSA
jgi:chloride channel protein, CIC family